MEDYKHELYHYGIKGMKWGVRRTAAQLGHVVKTGYKKTKAGVGIVRANRAAKKLRKKPISKLTDTELEQRLKRLELEKRVSDLSKSTQQINAGKQFVEAVGKKVVGPAMMDAGKSVLTTFFNKKFKNILGIDLEDTSNAMKLLKDMKLDDLNDSQIKKLAKRAEDVDNIKKKLLGQRDNQNQDVDDGTNSSKLAKDKSIDDMSDAEISKWAKRQEAINTATKNQKESKPDNNDVNSEEIARSKSYDNLTDAELSKLSKRRETIATLKKQDTDKATEKTESKKSDDLEKLLGKKISDLTDSELEKVNAFFRSLGI